MNEQSFVDRKTSDWRRLTVLCDMADKSLKDLSSDELREFVRLYRRISTDLAIARTKSTNVPLISYLNDLAGRAYGILYTSPRKNIFQSIVQAVAISAQTVRRNRWFIAVSAAIFFGSALFVGCTMDWVPRLKDKVEPAMFKSTIDKWKSGTFDERTGSESETMWGFYASNNPRVAILTGAVGAGSFGIFSIYLLFENGQILGALGNEMYHVGKLGFLVSSISPHGVPELSGVMVAGGSGFVLAYALINPGRRRRSDALRTVGRDAIVLLATSVVLMFIAAPIEAFFSFQPTIPQWLKGSFAVVSVVAWGFFWTMFGKEPTNPPSLEDELDEGEPALASPAA